MEVVEAYRDWETIVVDATTKMRELQEKANKNKNYIKND